MNRQLSCCGIRRILTVAYQRDFSMMEKGKWKTKYATLQHWYAALNPDLYKRVNNLLVKIYGSKKKAELLCKQK